MIKSMYTATAAFLLAAIGAGAATVSGTVRVATNNGGTGAAIADAKVVLYGFGGGGGGVQTPLDTATTNAQGAFSFTGVTTGFRQVVASKTGYQNGQAFANVLQNNGEYTANITMTATGVIGADQGVVTGTVRSGTNQGTAIAGASVVITRSAGGGAAAYHDSVLTNAQGQYRFDSVPAVNNFTVRVTAAGHNPATNSNVDVNEGDTTVANFALTPVPGPARPGRIAGTIRKAAGGAVINGATIYLSRNGTRLDTTRSNADGYYSFDSVAVNTNYTLLVTEGGYQNATNADVDVVANTTTIADFSLIATGGSTNGSIIGTVLDANKKPITNATLILSRSGFTGGSGPVDTVGSDGSGDFHFDNVPALQNYTITVSAPGFQTAVNNNVDVVAGQAVLADFVLVASGGTGVLARSQAASFRLSGGRGLLAVEFPSSPWAGRLSAYDARGALAYSGAVPAGTARMSLPSKSSIRFLVLERGGMIEKLQVAPVR